MFDWRAHSRKVSRLALGSRLLVLWLVPRIYLESRQARSGHTGCESLVRSSKRRYFLTGYAAASGIAFINSVASLGGFVGPSIIGAMANGTGGIYRGVALTGGSLFVSACMCYKEILKTYSNAMQPNNK